MLDPTSFSIGLVTGVVFAFAFLQTLALKKLQDRDDDEY